LIDRVFRQVLAPELNDIATSATGPYEFSLGIPLAQTPLVAAALDILRWAIGPLPLERICALMLSPHFAANSSDTSSELLARAEFDAFFLRDQHLLQPEMSLDSLFRLASEPTHRTGLPILLKHLATLRSLFATQRNIAGTGRTHSDWAAAIHEILDAAGWAVPGHLDSVEFQTRRKWESALDELATLDFDGTRVTFADAIAALARIASETLFAPESRHAPVQIMGPLESAGSNFDAVWFLRASDLAWPSRPATNPLLPWFMQRELDMPGANPAHDAAHARRLTERIAASAPTVVFSYALESANGRQRQSSALAELQLRLCIAYDLAPEVPSDAPIELDSAIDDAPIPPPPDRILQGGAGILKSQAQCGFRALAEKRLFASALKPASLGLNPQERGSLVHTVLESFWAEVKSQAALKLMTRAEREAQLNRSIEAAFARDYSREVSGWPLAYLAAERQRLINLLHPWLEYEASKRKTFTVQSREETSKDVQIGPLRLNIRVDRIDRVDLVQSEGDDQASTGEVILDYKTGPATPADWLGSRPNEPQLPLYAVVSKMPHLAGVAFANVRAGSDAGICGYQAQDGLLPKPAKLKTESLQDQVDDWRQLLESLADGFYSGEASVSPKSYPRTCALCQQRLLCRLDLATLDPEALDDFDTDIASIDFPSGEADIV
jgi:probable DNA repair protein